MTGLDTNVVVRYIVQDDPGQSEAATKLFETFTVDSPGYVSLVCLVELVWVLQSCYEVGREEIEALIEALLRSRGLIIEQSELVWRARALFGGSNAEFADCVIERSGNGGGCNHTVTFDRAAAKSAGMKLLTAVAS